MKKKPKIKKGSSLVAVLLVFFILTILGTAMLSLTLASYKRRSAETKIKSNLYASESGLAEAYSIIGKYVDKAYEEGNENVENELAILLDGEKEKLEKGVTSNYIDADGNINTTEIEKFESNKFTSAYKAYMSNSLAEAELSDVSKGKLKEELKNPKNYTALNANGGSAIKPAINVVDEIDNNGVKIISKFEEDKDKVEKYNLVLQSTFNVDDFEKIIQARYVIKVPTYSNANKLIRLTKNPVWSKAICADKDMKIKNGPVTITGDIYVKGNESTDKNKDVGIILESAESKLKVNGDLATAGNLETIYDKDVPVEKGSKIEVNGNVYAKNVITSNGANGSSISTNQSALPDEKSDGSIYVVDDMEVNAEKSTVNIGGGFYGVSDGSQPETDENKPDHSSAIIVNTEDIGKENGSTIEIGKEAYILGSAYISWQKYKEGNDYKYQTGESVAIKGNYRAYTRPVTGKTGVKFEYRYPLDLVFNNVADPKLKDLSIIEKSEYFKDYQTEYGSNSELILGRGITIKDVDNSIYSASIFSGSDENKPILSSNYLIDDNDKIKTKRNELKNQLFYMGFYNELKSVKSSEDITDDIKTPQNTVVGQVDFAAAGFDSDKNRQGITDNVVDQSKNIIFLNNNENKSYAFIGEGGREDGINAEKISINGTTFSGIIITEGDLYLAGNINFKGTIICGGNIYFTDDKEKTFNYDETYLNDIISKNYSVFKDVFKKLLSSKNDVYVNAVEGERNLVKSSMLEMKDWVIIK